MSAADLAAVIASVLSLGAVALITYWSMVMLRTLKAVTATLQQVQTEALPALQRASEAIEDARHEIERVDEIISAAEAVSSRIDGASRVAYLALSKPVIKTAAVASGTRRAARRLRANGE